MKSNEASDNVAVPRWTDLPATEKENYLAFHRTVSKEDLKHAENNILDFPRWSIISGYYCMHNLTKLFIAERFNTKISSPDIHAKTIEALEYFIRDDKLKEKLLVLLKEAKDIYYSTERFKEKTLPVLLKRGKQERGKAQYYSEDYTEKSKANSQKAAYFLDKNVRPYVELIKGLMK